MCMLPTSFIRAYFHAQARIQGFGQGGNGRPGGREVPQLIYILGLVNHVPHHFGLFIKYGERGMPWCISRLKCVCCWHLSPGFQVGNVKIGWKARPRSLVAEDSKDRALWLSGGQGGGAPRSSGIFKVYQHWTWLTDSLNLKIKM